MRAKRHAAGMPTRRRLRTAMTVTFCIKSTMSVVNDPELDDAKDKEEPHGQDEGELDERLVTASPLRPQFSNSSLCSVQDASFAKRRLVFSIGIVRSF